MTERNNFLGTGLSGNQFSVLAGDLASAIMGEHQNSWPAQVGRVGSQFGKSRIAADALQEKQGQDQIFRRQLMQYLMGVPGTGVGLTPADAPGDTDVTMKVGPDGKYSRTVTGISAPTQSSQATGQTQAQPQAQFQTNIAGQKFPFNPSVVPLF